MQRENNLLMFKHKKRHSKISYENKNENKDLQ